MIARGLGDLFTDRLETSHWYPRIHLGNTVN